MTITLEPTTPATTAEAANHPFRSNLVPESTTDSSFLRSPITCPEQLADAIASPRNASKLGDILLQQGLATTQQIAQALQRQQKADAPARLGETLVAMGCIEQTQVRAALARKLNIPTVELTQFTIEHLALNAIPGPLVEQTRALPIALRENRLFLAMEDPFDSAVLDVVQFYTRHELVPVLAKACDIDLAMRRYLLNHQADTANQALDELQLGPAADVPAPELQASLEREANDKPIVRLLNAILIQAVERRTSDITIRPQQNQGEVYFRIDGSHVHHRSLPKASLAPLISRIKIIGRMDIANRLRPQDGHAQIKLGDREVDLRISILPTVHGESAAVRVLDKQAGFRPLPQIGFREVDLARVRRWSQRSGGIVLVTGPTGSGKSTTLYAMLDEMRTANPHIVTLEEPVEYRMEQIEQIEIRNSTGFTFASALRNVLRHDPDVILVGEIRDSETARIANQAALTGHLVLSSLHTNDAASATTRLLDIGIEPYLLSSTLQGVIAQRLIGLNCAQCSREEQVDADVRSLLGLAAVERFYRGVGCVACDGTGYNGRTVVYELLPVDRAIRVMIRDCQDAYEIRQAAVAAGMRPLLDHALRLARAGRISLQAAGGLFEQ